ncbi:MAG: TFIIB-type zinc ribbon-containing protein [Candidatus Micrarchaeia archaeon]
MAKFVCQNCRLNFDAHGATACPRCTSRRLQEVGKPANEEGTDGQKQRVYSTSGPVLGESKESWKRFHNFDVKACPDCDGADFELNWKRKEKVCKKCGSVLPLPRRTA